MTRDDFTNLLAPLAQHGLTLAAGLFAAHSLTTESNLLTSISAAVALGAAGLGWTLIEKSKTLALVLNAAPKSDLDLLIGAVTDLRKNGASAIVLLHFTQALAAVANAEWVALQPQVPAPPSVDVPQVVQAPPVADPAPQPTPQRVFVSDPVVEPVPQAVAAAQQAGAAAAQQAPIPAETQGDGA